MSEATEQDRPIYHITDRERWERSVDHYLDPSLNDEGFIHCSFLDQLLGPANALFRGRYGLVVLVIDPSRLGAEVVVEDSYDSGTAYPHVYGPIEHDAVVDVVAFPTDDDGRFRLPAALS